MTVIVPLAAQSKKIIKQNLGQLKVPSGQWLIFNQWSKSAVIVGNVCADSELDIKYSLTADVTFYTNS